MKKLKIIEAGRILSPEESQKLKGGCMGGYGSEDCVEQYTGCNKHDECSILGSYLSCHPGGGAYGYETTCSDGSEHTSCADSHYYASCSNNRKYTVCSAGASYGGAC